MTEKCAGRVSGSCGCEAHVWMSFLLLVIFTACSRQPGYSEAPQKGQDISIEISTLQPGIPRYFSRDLKGMKINFFVVKKTDGSVISFLDACTKCYPQKKGFAFDSGSVVCRACDERYPLSEIEHGFGSCYPIKIEGRIQDDRYLISAADLEKLGAKYFR